MTDYEQPRSKLTNTELNNLGFVAKKTQTTLRIYKRNFQN